MTTYSRDVARRSRSHSQLLGVFSMRASSSSSGATDSASGSEGRTSAAADGAPPTRDASGAAAWAARCVRTDGSMRCWVDMNELYPDSSITRESPSTGQDQITHPRETRER